MKDLKDLNPLEIDFSKIITIENVTENIMLSEELLEKYFPMMFQNQLKIYLMM